MFIFDHLISEITLLLEKGKKAKIIAILMTKYLTWFGVNTVFWFCFGLENLYFHFLFEQSEINDNCEMQFSVHFNDCCKSPHS